MTYVNKKCERQTLPLNHALESNNAEMTKRLKYTKDILTHMLNNNNGTGKTSATGVGTSATASNLGGTGSNAGAGASSRMGTLSSAVSSKRSIVQGMGETGMPSSITGRISSSNNLNMLSSDRRPLNVINQVQ